MNKATERLKTLYHGVRLESKGSLGISPTMTSRACKELNLPTNTSRKIICEKLRDRIDGRA